MREIRLAREIGKAEIGRTGRGADLKAKDALMPKSNCFSKHFSRRTFPISPSNHALQESKGKSGWDLVKRISQNFSRSIDSVESLLQLRQL
jgi:hypothetical protein